MNSINLISKNRKLEIGVVIMTLLLYLFRTSIPIFKYPFIILFIIIIIYAIIDLRTRHKGKFVEFIVSYKLILILALLLIISFLFTYKIYLSVFKDIMNVLIILSIYYILNIIISTKKDLIYFSNTLIQLIIFFAFLISFSKFFESSKIFAFDKVIYNFKSISDKSPYIDWNFALLPVFFGMIGLFYLMPKSTSTLQKIFYNLLLLFFTYHILFSKSRRGLILLFIIIITLVSIKIVSFFKRNLLIEKINSASKYFIITLVVSFFILGMSIFSIPFGPKSFMMKKLFNREELSVKYNIAYNIHRSLTSFDLKIPFSNIYNTLWSVSYDPKDPDVGGWGTCIHQTVFPLTGKNVEIVPKDCKGYLLDSTCNVLEWHKNAYSVTVLAESEVENSDYIISSVNCFVSGDYNGESVSLSLEGVGSIIHDDYDLNTKDTWQALNVKMEYNAKNIIQIVLGFWRYKTTDFSNLKGYVIFANPYYEIVRKKALSTKTHVIQKPMSVLKSTTDSEIISGKLTCKAQIISSASFSFPFFLLTNVDKDPLRKWVSKLISEDTTYLGFNNTLFVDSIKSEFIGSRVIRWKFAWQIFTKEYNLTKKIFGGGFAFLNWYGYRFEDDKTFCDYPHNPVLYILLYSGIIGLCLYIILLYKAVIYYFKYIREYSIFFLLFLVSFFFSFFSAGNPFDPPVMGFLVILPFFIHNIHKKSDLEEDENIQI